MRLSEAVIVVAGAVSLASAVPLAGILGFPEVPNCAIPPFVKILATDGCSSLSDWVCHCNQAGLAGLIAPAVKQSCGSKDSYEATAQVVVETCRGAGVVIVVPLYERI